MNANLDSAGTKICPVSFALNNKFDYLSSCVGFSSLSGLILSFVFVELFGLFIVFWSCLKLFLLLFAVEEQLKSFDLFIIFF
jgi:hypothetical protein